jgi:hypothetical protein
VTHRTIPVEIPEDLYLDCLVAAESTASAEHPVVATLRRGLDRMMRLGAGRSAIWRQAEDLSYRDELETDVFVDDWHPTDDHAGTEPSSDADEIADRAKSDERAYGSPTGGLRWGPLFLPNTTKLRMVYKGSPHQAVIAHDALRYQDKAMSPSEFAAAVAGGTVRNPWRDLEIWSFLEQAWLRADLLRKDPAPEKRLLHSSDAARARIELRRRQRASHTNRGDKS